MNDENFEQWVRTSKVFVVDHAEANPRLHPSGAAVEATMATLTALPWQEAKSFRVGSIIQNYEKIRKKMLFPPPTATISAALAGRSRCALEFSDAFVPSASIFAASPSGETAFSV